MEYYADWKIDSTDSDFDIDSYFSLDSPSGNGLCMIFIFNTSIDENEHVMAQVKRQLERLIKNGTVSHYNVVGEWQNKACKGKFSGIFKGEMRTFAHSGKNNSILIVSQLFDSDKQQDRSLSSKINRILICIIFIKLLLTWACRKLGRTKLFQHFIATNHRLWVDRLTIRLCIFATHVVHRLALWLNKNFVPLCASSWGRTQHQIPSLRQAGRYFPTF